MHCRMKQMARNYRILSGIAACAVLLASCASVKSHWPFSRRAEPPPQPVAELVLRLPEDGSAPVVLQYWERNTLVVDLQAVSHVGEVGLVRREGQSWPARVAFRVTGQRFEVLEIRGAGRVVLPVSNAEAAPVTVELPGSVYSAQTAELKVRWGVRADF